jgi:tripartite-type tricarboxylate transporter receptor subunit TctC
MRSRFVLLVTLALTIGLLVVGCSQAATPAPTAAPAAPKAGEPTKPAAAAPTTAPAAAKVNFPEKGKSITFIIPWAAGGPTDVGGRLLASGLEKELGVPVQVVNKEGAGSQVGITALAKAKPDGYTVGMTNLPSSITPYLDPSRGASYGRKDLLPIANHVWDPETVGVAADSPYKTVKDLVDAAKAKPEGIKAAITGLQSDNHLALLYFQKEAGIKFSVVTMEGTAQANPALLGGHVDVLFQSSGGFATLVQGGKARLLGMMDKQPSKFYPDVKTFESQGYKVNFSSSRGISVPAGTPKEIVDVLAKATKKAMESADMQKKMDDGFLGMQYMDPAEYATYWDQFEAQTKELMALSK